MAHGHEQSLAYLGQQGKVKNFQLQNNAELVDHSKMQSIAALDEAKVVSKNVPNYVEKEEQPIELQSGPKKKVIVLGQQSDYVASNNDNNNEQTNNATDFSDDNNNNNDNNYQQTNNNVSTYIFLFNIQTVSIYI